MHLLPVARTRESTFSYTCHGCGRCCHGKQIRVGPYEAARLAEVLGTTTTDVFAQYVVPETSALRQTEEGACVFLNGNGCGVHTGRPTACRLYPLSWFGAHNGREAFAELSAHPQTEGVYGTDETVDDYLRTQETAPYERAAWRYAEAMKRLALAAEADGPDPGDPPPLTDVDAAVTADCTARGVPVPDDVEARVDLHLEILHRWLDAAGAPPAG